MVVPPHGEEHQGGALLLMTVVHTRLAWQHATSMLHCALCIQQHLLHVALLGLALLCVPLMMVSAAGITVQHIAYVCLGYDIGLAHKVILILAMMRLDAMVD